MQRRAMVFEAAHLAYAQKLWIIANELADQLGTIECNRGEDRRLGAVGEEVVGRLCAHVFEACRPPDHADLVVVSFTVDVGARIDQPPHHFDGAKLRRPMPGGRVVGLIARCDVETSPQQDVDAIKMAFAGTDMYQRPVPWAASNQDLP